MSKERYDYYHVKQFESIFGFFRVSDPDPLIFLKVGSRSGSTPSGSSILDLYLFILIYGYIMDLGDEKYSRK